MFGLIERDIYYIIKAASQYPEIEEIIIYGSRARGNYDRASDVDLAIKGENVDRKTINRLSDQLNEEYPLPYYFDLLNYHETSNEEIKKHIDEDGKSIYKAKCIFK